MINDDLNVDSFYKGKAKKRLLTPIGLLLDRMSYLKLLSTIVGIVVCWGFYWRYFYTFTNIPFSEAFYYSFVTFVSYTDINPTGFGRLMAGVEVSLGVFFIAVFIGKVASERQSTLLLLIYTSEQQKRLVDFASDLDKLSSELSRSAEAMDREALENCAEQTWRYLAGIKNYLNFQSGQGGLADFGNDSGLAILYNSVGAVQQAAIDAWLYRDTPERSRKFIRNIVQRTEYIGGSMNLFHRGEKLRRQTAQLVNEGKKFSQLNVKRENGEEVEYHKRKSIPDLFLKQVAQFLPPPPWKKNIHKDVAAHFGVTINFAHKSISKLVDTNYWSSNDERSNF